MGREDSFILIFCLLVSPVWAAKVPPDVNKTVTFVFVRDDTNGMLKPVGTAFVVGVPKENSKEGYLYLVTAKHVLSDEHGRVFNTIYIRINKVLGEFETFSFQLRGRDAVKVFYPSDQDVDIAVIPWNVPAIQGLSLDFQCIPLEMLATKAKVLEAKIGPEMICFFWDYSHLTSGRQRIIRSCVLEKLRF